MRDLIKGLKLAEAMGAAGDQGPLLEELRKQAEGLMPVFPGPPRFTDQFKQFAQNQGMAEALVDEASVKIARVIYEKSKKGFLERSAALNEKQLELLDLEQRMNMIP
jgi:hypothetical protein